MSTEERLQPNVERVENTGPGWPSHLFTVSCPLCEWSVRGWTTEQYALDAWEAHRKREHDPTVRRHDHPDDDAESAAAFHERAFGIPAEASVQAFRDRQDDLPPKALGTCELCPKPAVAVMGEYGLCAECSSDLTIDERLAAAYAMGEKAATDRILTSMHLKAQQFRRAGSHDLGDALGLLAETLARNIAEPHEGAPA